MDARLIGDRELAVKLEAAGPALQAELVNTVRGLQIVLQNGIKRLLSGEVLRNRTGNLRESIVPGELEVTDTRVAGIVGSNSKYARVQELGGQITAKNVGNLTIPLDAVLTANGVARYSARDVIANPGIGGFIGTFFAKGMLFGTTGKGDATPLFVLRKSVTIPAHAYMARAIAELKPQAEEAMRGALATVAGKLKET